MTDATRFGTDLWLHLAPTFDDSAALDGYGQHPEKAQVYIGFIAAACGAMSTECGYDSAMQMLAAIAQTIHKKQNPLGVTH